MALGAATGGETIVLEDGNYDSVEVSDKNYADHVTIMAANARQAVFTKIGVNNAHDILSSGFVFFGVSDIVIRRNNADWLQSDGFKAGPGLTIEDLRPVAGSPADDQVGAYERIHELIDP